MTVTTTTTTSTTSNSTTMAPTETISVSSTAVSGNSSSGSVAVSATAATMPQPSSESDAADTEFEPTAEMMMDEYDDERTLDEAEAQAAIEGEDQQEEINNLQKVCTKNVKCNYFLGLSYKFTTGLFLDTSSSTLSILIRNEDIWKHLEVDSENFYTYVLSESNIGHLFLVL